MARFLSSCLAAVFGLTLLAPAASALSSAAFPPSADVGQCFARVLTPDVTEVIAEQVEAQPASTKQIVIPATYETQTVRVEVKQATKTYRTIPATYRTVTEQVLVTPEREELSVIPAKYETWSETIEIEPAKTVWKTGSGLYGRGMPGTGAALPTGDGVATGEILCLVTEPAKTRTVRRSRMVEPPRTERRVTPAVYKSVNRLVVADAPQVEEIVVPAEYADFNVRVMTSPSRVEVQTIPAVFKTVERRVVRASGGLQWAEVLCDTNSTASKVADIQRQLTAAGYPVPVDGVFGPRTQSAMERYQRAKGLAVGYMTVETVRSLSIDPYR